MAVEAFCFTVIGFFVVPIIAHLIHQNIPAMHPQHYIPISIVIYGVIYFIMAHILGEGEWEDYE